MMVAPLCACEVLCRMQSSVRWGRQGHGSTVMVAAFCAVEVLCRVWRRRSVQFAQATTFDVQTLAGRHNSIPPVGAAIDRLPANTGASRWSRCVPGLPGLPGLPTTVRQGTPQSACVVVGGRRASECLAVLHVEELPNEVARRSALVLPTATAAPATSGEPAARPRRSAPAIWSNGPEERTELLRQI